MTTLAFAVRRKEPVLVRPATETPHETKRLSDIDDQVDLRRHTPNVFFYRGGGGGDRDPVAVIRRALGGALVPYYPLAGRLRELESGELVVDCTGEGVLFAEADAGVRLAELEAAGLRPPFPYMDRLLFDFDASSRFLNRPFLLVQVTRLLCGGFVLAFRVSHMICDGTGVGQFMSAVAELARGLPSPTIPPAWSREILRAARIIHRPTQAAAGQPDQHDATTVVRTFTFGPSEIAAIRTRLPPGLRETATTFEVLTAAVWVARTAALELRPDERVGLLFTCNLRGVRDLGLPVGYYGNAIVRAAALTTSGELLAGSLGDAVEQIQRAKAAVTAELVRSTTDPLTLRARAELGTLNAFRVSDIRRVGLQRVDFGWGEPVYSGRADNAQLEVSFLVAVKSGRGENAVAVSVVLPRAVMDRLADKVEMLLPAVPASPAPQARL